MIRGRGELTPMSESTYSSTGVNTIKEEAALAGLLHAVQPLKLVAEVLVCQPRMIPFPV